MRRTELDLCRIFACLLILMIHAAADIYHALPLSGAAFFAVTFLSTLSRAGLPLFFMLTGTLLLSREKLDVKQNFRHRVLRYTGMYYLWSLLYALARAASGALEGPSDFLYAVIAGHYHLWFLPAMVMVCLFLPVVHATLWGSFSFSAFFSSTATSPLTPRPSFIALHRISALTTCRIWGILSGAGICRKESIPTERCFLRPLPFSR